MSPPFFIFTAEAQTRLPRLSESDGGQRSQRWIILPLPLRRRQRQTAQSRRKRDHVKANTANQRRLNRACTWY
jgi:hypothetical protein